MKKTTRNILIMLAVLLVLGGGLAALLLLPAGTEEEPASQPESSQVTEESKTVMEHSLSEVKRITVKNSEDEYALLNLGEDFTVEGYEDCALSTAVINSSVNSVLTIHADRDLGSRDNLEEFGLAGENAVELTVEYAAGGSDRLVLGGPAGESAGRYVLKDGTVYLAARISELLYGGKYGFFDKTLYTIADRTETDETGAAQSQPDILYHLELSGESFPEPIRIEYNESLLNNSLMVAPVTAEAGTALQEERIIPALKAPVATGVAAAHLTRELLEEYGLAEPAAAADFDVNNEAHVIRLSKARGGSRYMLLDDRDVIYTVSDDSVSCWANTDVTKLRMSYIWLANIVDVKTLTVTVDGDQVYRFDVSREPDEEKSTEGDPSYILHPVNAGGEAIGYENYRAFYRELAAIAVLNADRVEYGGTPAYRVRYEYQDGLSQDVEVAFYPAGEDRYVAELDGGFNGQVRRSEADKVFSYLPDLNQNKPRE